MATTFAIRLMSGVGFQVELPHGKPLAKEVKMAIKDAKGINVYDQRLVLDGQELPNFSEVETDQEILLIIGATNVKEIVMDYLRNRGAVPEGEDYYHADPALHQPGLTGEKLVKECTAAANGFFPFPGSVALAEAECTTETKKWLESFQSEDFVRQYLDDLREVSWAVQASRNRAKQSQDPYDRDILDLRSGEIPCQAMLDYRERSWSRLSVEDAVEVNRKRDSFVQDRFERDVLDRWERPEGGLEAMRAYASACGASGGQDTCRGWVELLPAHQDKQSTGVARQVIVVDGCECPAFIGLVDVAGQGLAWPELRELPLPGSATASDWLPAFAGLKVSVRDQPVILIEPMHSKRAWRNEVCESLMSAGIPAIGFIPAAVAACQIHFMMTNPIRTMIVVDVGAAHISVTPVYEGYLLVPAICAEEHRAMDLEEASKVSAAIEASLVLCPVDTHRSLRRCVRLIGRRSSEALAHRLMSLPGDLSVTASGPDAAWKGATKVCAHPQLHRLLTTREEYLEHGPSAVHRKCF
ncbi:ACT9 [Symbiodinium pilosum]|uniref:ACT9 protein n=1 Tax=Symbiodinium pilosum TaxID=2952 RepID=A0A812S9K7_SYMPI|nr:ACT9 [Symbiodinium pilosum]